MTINLGFSIGPALGGLLASISFRWLFIADGVRCIASGLFFFLYFKNLKGHKPKDHATETQTGNTKSVYQDRRFLVFILLTSCFALLFFQLFITLPLYYREVYQLSEGKIGGLLGLNGLVVYSMEMILMYILGKDLKIIPSFLLV